MLNKHSTFREIKVAMNCDQRTAQRISKALSGVISADVPMIEMEQCEIDYNFTEGDGRNTVCHKQVRKIAYFLDDEYPNVVFTTSNISMTKYFNKLFVQKTYKGFSVDDIAIKSGYIFCTVSASSDDSFDGNYVGLIHGI